MEITPVGRREAHSVMQLTVVSEQLTNDLKKLGDKVGLAVSRALVKTERWLKVHSMREIGKELNINQSAIKHRYKIQVRGQSIRLWFGLLNVAAHDAGTPSQNRAGVRVRGRQFDSAFYRRVYGGAPKVYIRARKNMRLGHTTYTADGKHRTNRFYNHGFMTGNEGRFPLQVIGVEIEPKALEVLQRYEHRINARYEEILAQEVNYVLMS